MSDDKIITVNDIDILRDERPEWLDSDNRKLIGNVDTTMNYGEPFIPINPETKKPCYHSVFEENDAVWIERPALQDKPYLMAFFADKSIKELEAMFRQEPNIEAPSNSKK